jgi:deoxyribodipyrimidine photolyase
MASAKGAVAMHWFRKGLRLHDNAALLEAASGAAALFPGASPRPPALLAAPRTSP